MKDFERSAPCRRCGGEGEKKLRHRHEKFKGLITFYIFTLLYEKYSTFHAVTLFL